MAEDLSLPHPRRWSPEEDDWSLPEDWRDILAQGIRDRLARYRSFKIFMDVCVRCGACADKCHFYLGSGDPRNMPVLRAELLRAVYRNDFTLAGKLFGRLAGGRRPTPDTIKEWYAYFHQCSECRRCSVFCPFGIDTAEITMMARELLLLLGIHANWIMEPVRNCERVGNHLGIQPHTMREILDCLADDIEEVTGVRVEIPLNRKGAEVLFVTPSGDLFAEPGIYTFMGYVMLFHEIGLDWTMSTYASEGGNFGIFASHELMKKLNAKVYAEAERLGVRWILGGECGHMWRVFHQYMDTPMNGPADFLEIPRSPVTGAVFRQAASAKAVHIAEFTADLIRHGKLALDPSRNDAWTVTFHDSCNPARGMGLFEEPRLILRSVCNRFHEMPPQTIREQTFCCGSGGGLNSDEIMELRLRGGLPRGNALRHVQRAHGVNLMACQCAIDRVTLGPVADYWAPGVRIAGVHELLGNALVMRGGKERTMNLRQESLIDPEEES